MARISRKYPYLPEGREILYVPESNKFMQAAKENSEEYSTDLSVSTGAVAVKDGVIVGNAANQSAFRNHPALRDMHTKVCVRRMLGIKTGTHYWVCPGCADHHYHAEYGAVRDAEEKGNDTKKADVYMYGHWWCCKPCWNAMIAAGIKNVYLLEKSWEIFDI